METRNPDALLPLLPFWEDLTGPERDMVTSRRTIVHFAQGQQIRGGDEDCLGLLVVAEGVLRAHLLSPDGRDVTLYRMREGDCCVLTAACVLDAISFETHIEADEATEALLVPADVYAALLRQNVHVEAETYRLAAERFSEVVASMERLVFLSLEQRIASFLLDETSDTHQNTIHMTQEQIAVNIGSAREAVSRALKGMANRGWIELFRGGIKLIDKPALYAVIEE